jgi:hypothetical protein
MPDGHVYCKTRAEPRRWRLLAEQNLPRFFVGGEVGFGRPGRPMRFQPLVQPAHAMSAIEDGPARYSWLARRFSITPNSRSASLWCVGRDREKARLERLASLDADYAQVVRQAALLQHDRNLPAVRHRSVVELNRAVRHSRLRLLDRDRSIVTRPVGRANPSSIQRARPLEANNNQPADQTGRNAARQI